MRVQTLLQHVSPVSTPQRYLAAGFVHARQGVGIEPEETPPFVCECLAVALLGFS